MINEQVGISINGLFSDIYDTPDPQHREMHWQNIIDWIETLELDIQRKHGDEYLQYVCDNFNGESND